MSSLWPERRWSSWFSLAREQGGPTYYSHQYFRCPDFVWNPHTVISIVVFISPILIFLILLPSFRRKHWSSLMVVLLCFLTGFTLTVVMWSSSWLVGKAEMTMSVGPLRPPVTGTVGVWAGLRHVNLTYITANLSLNEEVTWNSRTDLVRAHKSALRDGWPWALLSVTAELGGEGSGWRGCLGDGIKQAGILATCLVIASACVWMVWVVLFTVSAELTARPLMLTGLLMAMASLVYVVSISAQVPAEFMVGGAVMHMRLGFAWWLTSAVGVALTLVGSGLLLYNARRPGHLTTFFEIDFGLASHRSFQPLSHEPVFAYQQVETYSQYPDFVSHAEHNSTKDIASDSSKGKNDGNDKGLDNYMCNETLSDKAEGADLNRVENMDDSQTSYAPKIKYFYETETNHPSRTSSSSQKQLMPPANRTLKSCGTLAHKQEHTPLNAVPTTLRRRSPEQPQEQDTKEQVIQPGGTGSAEPSPCISGSDSNGEDAPRQRSQGATPSRYNAFVRSFRKSIRRSISKAHTKYDPRISARLTRKSRSQSLSELMSEQDWLPNTDPVSHDEVESSTRL